MFDLSPYILAGSEWVAAQGAMGPVYYALLLAIWVMMCLPCSVLEIVPGFLFGWPIGVAVALSGKLLGNFGSILLGRSLLRSWARRTLLPKSRVLRAMARVVQPARGGEAWKAILLCRVTYMPMMIKNYGLAAMGASTTTCLACGLASGLPFAILWAYIGTQCKSLLAVVAGEGGAAVKGMLPGGAEVIGLVLVVVTFALIGRYVKRSFDELVAEEEAAAAAKQQ